MTNRLISFFLFVLLIFPSCSKQDSKNIAQNELQQFYCCSTVDWAKLDTLYYRPYNCDWAEKIGAQIHPEFPPEYSGIDCRTPGPTCISRLCLCAQVLLGSLSIN